MASMAVVGGLVSETHGILSAVSGGLVGLIPNAYFIWRSQMVRGGTRPGQVVLGLYQAEAGKFGLTVALFALVFVTVPPSNPTFFFGAYVAVIFTHWLTPWLIRD